MVYENLFKLVGDVTEVKTAGWPYSVVLSPIDIKLNIL